MSTNNRKLNLNDLEDVSGGFNENPKIRILKSVNIPVCKVKSSQL